MRVERWRRRKLGEMDKNETSDQGGEKMKKVKREKTLIFGVGFRGWGRRWGFRRRGRRWGFHEP